MFFVNYDLAKQITHDRRADARAAAMRRANKRHNRTVPHQATGGADVIELSFAAPCEQESIGA